VEEEGGMRKIWGKSFELLRCSACGKPFATREELVFQGLDEGDLLCDRCRKREFAASFTRGVR
jgi:hypothetical protein